MRDDVEISDELFLGFQNYSNKCLEFETTISDVLSSMGVSEPQFSLSDKCNFICKFSDTQLSKALYFKVDEIDAIMIEIDAGNFEVVRILNSYPEMPSIIKRTALEVIEEGEKHKTFLQKFVYKH